MDKSFPTYIPITIEISFFINWVVLFLFIYVITFLILKRKRAAKLYRKSILVSMGITALVMVIWGVFTFRSVLSKVQARRSRMTENLTYYTHYDTLIINHQECTDCLDGFIESGHITYPPELKEIADQEYKDIILDGESPYEGKVIGDIIGGDIFEKKIKIIGHLNRIDSSNSVGHMPAFYVNHWEIVEDE